MAPLPVLSPTVIGVLAEAAALPVRLAVAGTRTTLQLGRLSAPDGPLRRPGGYAELLLRVIGEGGYFQQVTELLTAEDGPMRLAATIADLTAPDRPLGRMLMRDGVLDRLLAEDGPLERLLAEGGALDRLVAQEGALDRLLAAGGALDRLTEPGGVLDQLLVPGGLADRMLSEDGFVEKLVADGGTLDQLLELGATLEAISPRLRQLAELIPSLSDSADALGRSVAPLGDLAGRIPLTRRR